MSESSEITIALRQEQNGEYSQKCIQCQCTLLLESDKSQCLIDKCSYGYAEIYI